MRWYQRIIAAHTTVTDAVSHGQRLQSDRYFVWQEDGGDDFTANGRHGERAVEGTTDLYSKRELDPWADALSASLNAAEGVAWYLNTVQFEPETGYWHWEWVWSVVDGNT